MQRLSQLFARLGQAFGTSGDVRSLPIATTAPIAITPTTC